CPQTLRTKPSSELGECLTGRELAGVDLKGIAHQPMHAVGLRARHTHRTMAAPQLAFGSDLGRATNCHPRRLQLVEYLEPIAEYFIVDDDVVDDHVQPGAGGCRDRAVVCVQQPSTGCRSEERRG